MTLHLSDSHESTLHVTLGHGDSALDVYEKEEPQAEGGRASLLDEVGVLYFVAKARDAFRGRAAH